MSQNDQVSVLTKAPDCMGKNRLCGKTFFLFTGQAASNTVYFSGHSLGVYTPGIWAEDGAGIGFDTDVMCKIPPRRDDCCILTMCYMKLL